MSSFGERVIGAAKLEVRIFEEVESDPAATGQAMAVVVLSSLAAGLGSYGLGGFTGMLRLTAVSLIGWAIWAVLIYFIGTKLLPEPQTKSNIPEMLRTIGFASAPGLLRFVGILPLIGVAPGFPDHRLVARGQHHSRAAGAGLSEHPPRCRRVLDRLGGLCPDLLDRNQTDHLTG